MSATLEARWGRGLLKEGPHGFRTVRGVGVTHYNHSIRSTFIMTSRRSRVHSSSEQKNTSVGPFSCRLAESCLRTTRRASRGGRGIRLLDAFNEELRDVRFQDWVLILILGSGCFRPSLCLLFLSLLPVPVHYSNYCCCCCCYYYYYYYYYYYHYYSYYS